jgi:parallel beta-helix repeat protein
MALLFMGSVCATDDDLSNATLNSSEESILNDNADEILTSSNVIVVDEIEKNHNEMNSPTIQKAINDASDGDTIVVNGESYVHCHFTVNKKLTIISNVGTVLDPCSSKAGSNHQGIFYLSSKASGTVIQGFTFVNDNYVLSDNEGYGILVKGACDVTIKDCNVTTKGIADSIMIENAKNTIIDNVNVYDSKNGIKSVNSQNLVIKNSKATNCNYGIRLIDSTKTTIESNSITRNSIAGIAFSGTGSYLTVIYNNITENLNGINLTSSDHIYILGNCISFNNDNGVYVDNNITSIEIKGNFFNQNHKWEVFNDFHVKNINDIYNSKSGDLEIIDNNYMINYGGSGSGDMDRPVWSQVYEHKPGQYNYDAENDVYVYVGSGGEYYGHQGVMFLRYVFEINEYVYCPNIYSAPRKIWSQTSKYGNFELELGNITQIKKGIYSISIGNEKGEIASELSSVPVTFYINKAGTSSTPQEGDVYKIVMMKNGTATVRFYSDEFSDTGNVITAVFPTPGTNIDDKVSKSLNINDSDIPGTPLNTTVSVFKMNTYPNSNQELVATLKDSNGKAIAGETLSFKINSRIINSTTDGNGQAKIKISESKEGTYAVTVSYAGDGDIDYYASGASATVTVKKQSVEIISSNLNMIPKMAEYFSVTFKDGSGNPLANQKVTFKVNGKTYNKYTDNKGVAKVKLKFNKNKKTYKISVKFAGSNQYKSVSKTNKITVKYSSKTAKLSSPTVTIPPKTSKSYTVSLKDANGNAISKQKVTVKINGKKYAKKTNSKGQIQIKVKFFKLKSFKVTASYKGSKIYKKSSSSGKIKVAKTTTKITAPAVSVTPKQSKTYTVTLKADNKGLSKQKLTIKVNGKTYTKTTDSKGQASISVNFADEKSYPVTINYKGTGIYKASKATGKIDVSKITSQIESYNRTYSKDSTPDFEITLKDKSGNALANQKVSFTYNGVSNEKTTDANGKANVELANLDVESFDIVTKFSGSDKYKAVSKTNKITISNKTNTIFVDAGLPNFEIQNILNGCSGGSNVEFLGDSYSDISLNVKKGINIYSVRKTVLNAKTGNPVFMIESNDVNISGFSLKGASSDAIVIDNAQNIIISDNSISNNLDEGKISAYAEGTVNMPGYGIHVSNSSGIRLTGNVISQFESAIFVEHSSNLGIDNNTLRENNYGIKYGFGVANTEILNNEILEQIGLYIMTVPEGPSGYGIFLNNSAVNVTINHNHIAYNHLGISLDANYSIGIVITQNTITDNVLEGMRFNAGYDLAENAVEPIVTDNAIYRNARGPSMMILGELSANPFGIYGGGLLNPEERLNLDSNWYGTNELVTWDNDTGVVGYGTMCPRINTTGIGFNLTYNSPGNYSIKFYKNGELASNLPEFDMFATLNNETEINFMVVDGIGTFSFNASSYKNSGNVLDISIGSLIDSTSRTFKVTYRHDVLDAEIPI